MGISSPISSIERSFNIFSAFLNISSNFAASGSVAARAARRGPTFLDKDIFASPTPSLVNGSKENCPLLLKKHTKSDGPAAPRIGRACPFGTNCVEPCIGALRFQPFASGEIWKLDNLPRNWANPVLSVRGVDPSPMEITRPILAAIWKYGHGSNRASIVAADVEYEELPRGRVVYNAKTSRFAMLCGLCILKNRKLVQKIKFASSNWGCRSANHRS